MKTPRGDQRRVGRAVDCGSLLPLWVGAACCAAEGAPRVISEDLPATRSELRPPHSGSKLPRSTARPALRWPFLFSFLALAVAASAAIKQEIPDLKPPREEVALEQETSGVWPWVLAGGLASLLLVFSVWPRPPKRVALESPAAIARRELQGVTAPQKISHLLRRYVLAAFPLPGEGASTEEISECLFAHIPTDPTLAHQVTEFLLACDTQKFAPSAGASPELAALAAGWTENKTAGSAPATAAPAAATNSAAEVALSLIDKMEKRRRRTAQEKAA
jgi:hypothetical protein